MKRIAFQVKNEQQQKKKPFFENSAFVDFYVADMVKKYTEWGHDFRPSYKQLTHLRQQFPGVPIIAVTATATKRVADEIVRVFCFFSPQAFLFFQRQINNGKKKRICFY